MPRNRRAPNDVVNRLENFVESNGDDMTIVAWSKLLQSSLDDTEN